MRYQQTKRQQQTKHREFDLFCLFSDFNLFSFSFNSMKYEGLKNTNSKSEKKVKNLDFAAKKRITRRIQSVRFDLHVLRIMD